MKSKQIEAYNYYKRLYPEAIILFHIGANLIALFEDALRVAKVLNRNADDVVDRFELSYDDLNSIAKLGDHFRIQIIDYRDDNGNYDFPDIERLKREKYADY